MIRALRIVHRCGAAWTQICTLRLRYCSGRDDWNLTRNLTWSPREVMCVEHSHDTRHSLAGNKKEICGARLASSRASTEQ